MKIVAFAVNKHRIGSSIVKYNFSGEKPSSELFNPYTRQFLSSKPYLTNDEIFTKISNATSAHRKWKSTLLETRI